MSRSGLAHAPQPAQASAGPSPMRVGPTHDVFEQNADRAAERVTAGQKLPWSLSRVGTNEVQRKCTCGGTCEECKKKKKNERLLQRQAKPGAAAPAHAPASVSQTLRRPGRALDAGTRTYMESRFGHDFTGVRIHADDQAAASVRDVSAAAYTVGNQVVFGSGLYQPGTRTGDLLLAHELTHVVQQGGSLGRQRGPQSEDEARSAGQEIALRGGRYTVLGGMPVGIAAMSFAELRQEMWSKVPDSAKDYVRPAARGVAETMDKYIPPNTEVPKPIENAMLHPVDTAVNAAEHPLDAAQSAVQTVKESAPIAKDAAKKLAAEAPRIIKEKVKKKVHDTAMRKLGQVKGVVLEATQIVDTVAWGPQAVHELETKALGDSASAKAVIDATDHMTRYTELHALARMGLNADDPSAKKPGDDAGEFAISGIVSKGIDTHVADPLEQVTGNGKPDDSLFFTEYEKGEIEGSIGTQAALAVVGAEEVQLALKVIGLVGGAKQLVEAIEKNPKGWKTDLGFWALVVGMGLQLIGLKAGRSGSKIVRMVLAAGQLVTLYPAVEQLYDDWKKLPEGPEKDKRLSSEAAGIVKAVGVIIIGIVHAGTAGGKKPGSAEPVEGGGKVTVMETPAGEKPAPAKESATPADQPMATPGAEKPAGHPAGMPADEAPAKKAAAPAADEVEHATPAGKSGKTKPDKVTSLDEFRQKRAASTAPAKKAAAPAADDGEHAAPAEESGKTQTDNVTSLDEYRQKKQAGKTTPSEPESQVVPAGQEHAGEAQSGTAAGAEQTVPQNTAQPANQPAAATQPATGAGQPQSGGQAPQQAPQGQPVTGSGQAGTPPQQIPQGQPANSNAPATGPKIDVHGSSGNAWVTTEGVVQAKGTFTKVRSPSEQTAVAGKTGDDAGHREAAGQGGAPGRENLARQNRIMNRPGGSWRELEKSFEDETANGTRVWRRISDIYRPEDLGRTEWDATFAKDLADNPKDYRPYRRHVEWTLTDQFGNVERGELDFVNTKTPEVRRIEAAQAAANPTSPPTPTTP